MKRPFDIRSWLKASQTGFFSFHVLRRVFAANAIAALLMIVLAGLTVLWQSFAAVEPKAAIKQAAASVTSEFFIDMLGMEADMFRRDEESFFSGKRIGMFLAGLMLNVNPYEPKSFIASELPVLQRVWASSGTPDQDAGAGQDGGTDAGAGDGSDGDNAPPASGQEPAPQPLPGEQPGGTAPDPLPTGYPADRKVVFIYHSHPRESWVPELKVSSVNEAEDEKTNVTLLGKRLADKLEEIGIGALHSGIDYPTAVEGYNWNFSYKYSLQTVKEAFAANPDIRFLFDIHRDSAARNVTTAAFGGKEYARVYFIVGKKNENWQQNEAFAKKIHSKLEAKYPGLSRGIWDKGSGGHAEYNQSVSPNSILIEVGGPHNTIEESNRTIDILAEVIAEVYLDAEKVNASAVAQR